MIDFRVDPADVHGNSVILTVGEKATHNVRVLVHDGFVKNENTYDFENKRFFPTHLRKWGAAITIFEDNNVKELKKEGVPQEDALEHRYPSNTILHIKEGHPVHVFVYDENIKRVVGRESFIEHQVPMNVYDEENETDGMTLKKEYYYKVKGFEIPVHPVFVRPRTIEKEAEKDANEYGLLDTFKSFGRLTPLSLNDITKRASDYYIWIKSRAINERTGKPINDRKGVMIVTDLDAEFGSEQSLRVRDPLTNDIHQVEKFDTVMRVNNFISLVPMYMLANRVDGVVHNLIAPEISPYTVFISRYVQSEIPDMFNVFKEIILARTDIEYEDGFLKDVVDTIKNPSVFCFGITYIPEGFKGWPYFRWADVFSAAAFVAKAHEGIVSVRKEDDE